MSSMDQNAHMHHAAALPSTAENVEEAVKRAASTGFVVLKHGW
eukprot:CAMPEP_0172774928 /NCGR_PEP_ID=MMETSP1074-20121228/197060_1 /TAXON_ID=2916 /ORGANISM="Ceratium fusus, Strain PA161109" /LENGTH=42 /DNA_ID= /DNA_START= /DNA_END= /DNA_ORIENTATION=